MSKLILEMGFSQSQLGDIDFLGLFPGANSVCLSATTAWPVPLHPPGRPVGQIGEQRFQRDYSDAKSTSLFKHYFLWRYGMVCVCWGWA